MRRSVIIAVVLFLSDAFVLNQGVIALTTLIIVLPVLTLRAILHRKDKPLLKKRLTACGIYLTMAVLILIANTLNNSIAKKRAQLLIEACEKYKEIYNSYPARLSDLVPDFMDTLPVAKYTLSSNRFFYIASAKSHLLYYVTIPPFGRPTYSFEKQKWTYMD